MLLNEIFKYYELNEIEKKVFEDYKRIINISFFLHVELWVEMLEKKLYVSKVIDLLSLLMSDIPNTEEENAVFKDR